MKIQTYKTMNTTMLHFNEHYYQTNLRHQVIFFICTKSQTIIIAHCVQVIVEASEYSMLDGMG